MNARMLIILGLGTLLAVALALVFVGAPEESPEPDENRLLLPALADRINEIDALEIIAPDGETVATLHRERERWRMREKHDYEADFARIHDLLRDLAQARRLEAKTERAEWYGRLGVDAPGRGEGSGVMIRFPDDELPALIIGQQDPAGIGRYARLEGEDRTWLIGRNPDLPVERMEWLERAIMDIPAADIRAVSVRHSDGDGVELRPGDDEGGTWVMLDPPAGREVKPAWQLRQTASALARLNMSDVRPHEAELVPQDAVETVFRTRDGMVFTAVSFSDEAGKWVHFRVSGDETGEGGTEEVDEPEADAAEPDREIDIVAVDGRLSPWQFALTGERFDRLRPTVEQLLVAEEESAEVQE